MKAAPNNLEQNLLSALKALDNQILRAMQREPAEREVHGIKKWQPYQDRIESICSLLLNSLGDEKISLDGIIILTQALSKTLNFVVADLGSEGLGKVRAEYIQSTFENIKRDAEDCKSSLGAKSLLS